MEEELPWLLLGALVFAFFAVRGVLSLATDLRRGLIARLRRRRALAGEKNAERMLERQGYRIVERQARAVYAPTIDGRPAEVEVRADLLVRRRGRRYVAEVKTGQRAPSLLHAPTRRQLLEYERAYACDGVLLVRPETGEILEIAFPARSSEHRGPRWAYLLWGIAIGALGGAFIVRALVGALRRL